MPVRFQDSFSNVKNKVESELANNMEKALQHLQSKMYEKLSQPGHGRWYKIKGKWHRASAPGEPPAKLTGKLRGSISYRIIRGKDKVTGIIGSVDEKSPYLEFGTSRMAPRPYFKVTYEENREEIKNILES